MKKILELLLCGRLRSRGMAPIARAAPQEEVDDVDIGYSSADLVWAEDLKRSLTVVAVLRAGGSEEFVTDVARVMENSAACGLDRDDLETAQVSAAP